MKAKWGLRRRYPLQLESLEDRTLLSTFTVNVLTDTGQGTGLAGDLRYCITQATSGQDTITFSVTGTINLTKALPDLAKSVSINGPGSDFLTVRRDTGGSYRIFTVDSGVTVALSGLTIANGSAPPFLELGGGISNDGMLTVSNCALSSNSAFEGGGGGIYNSASGVLTVTSSSFTHDTSGDGLGGAIRNDGTMVLSTSTLTNNNAGGGGAIQNHGLLTISNCALSSNSANDGGGIENLSGTLTVSNSTLSGNVASDGGGGAIQSAFSNSGTVLVSGSSLSGNSAAFFGSAIDCAGALTILNSIVSGNRPLAPAVGAIYIAAGTAMLSNSILSANSANGGALVVSAGTVTVNYSTISGNAGRDVQAGGGILSSGTLTISNSTISGNSVNNPDSAGAIFNRGSLTVTNSTISGNTNAFTGPGGTAAAGGIASLAFANQDATAGLLNCTIANNTVSVTNQPGGQLVAAHLGSGSSKASVALRNSILSGDGSSPNFLALTGGAFLSQGHNLSSDSGGGFLTGPGDLVNTNPLLGPLQDNGGPTQTMALLPGSPAVDAGDNANVPDFDQRGPGFPRIVGGIVDLGAFEVQPGPATHLQVTAPAGVTSNTPFSITVTALDAFGHTATGYLGTVTFSSTDTDPAVILPSDYPFTAADSGVHVFSNAARLRTPGSQTITVSDTVTASISGSAAVVVSLPLFIVTTNLDSGPGSLRQAILDADGAVGPDTIRFAIGTGLQTINLASPLPAITQPVLIDGTSQPGYAGAPLIELNGAGAGPGADGLLITAGGSIIRGLVINRFTLNGIELQNGGSNVIQGNYLGTDVTGTLALGNGIGLRISASNNIIGGTAAGAGNVIAGNLGDGIFIANGTANLVQGNEIGTNASHTAGLGNLGNGVHLLNASGNTIGGTVAGAANSIAFNSNDGVLVDGGTGNGIRHNAILMHTTGLGIELLGGGNNRLPFPVLTSATSDGSSTTVQGLLQSTPNTTFALEFFANLVCNPSGFGEGEQFLGSVSATTNSHGTASFTVTFASAVPSGQFIAATATDSDNNTSAFSNCVSVAGPVAPPGMGPGNRGGANSEVVLLGPITPSGAWSDFNPNTGGARRGSEPDAPARKRAILTGGSGSTRFVDAFFSRMITSEARSKESGRDAGAWEGNFFQGPTDAAVWTLS